MQCDPAACRQSLINHAKYVCVTERARAAAAVQCAPRGRRNVLLIVHLPLGIGQRQRHFVVDFSPGWHVMFVDDLRPDVATDPESTEEHATLLELLECSAHELVSAKKLDLHALLRARIHTIVLHCATPSLDASAAQAGVSRRNAFGVRARLCEYMLNENPAFSEQLRESVNLILESRAQLGADGAHTHVSLVLRGRAGGTLRQSLRSALERVVTEAATVVLVGLDTNFNLELLPHATDGGHSSPEGAATLALWTALCGSARMPPGEALAQSRVLAPPSPHDGAGDLPGSGVSASFINVGNTGKHGTLVARYPFSWRVHAVLDAPQTRGAIDTEAARVDSHDTAHQLDHVLRTVFGVEQHEAMARYAQSVADAGARYLHDLVAHTPSYTGLSFEATLEAYHAVVGATRFDALSGPAAHPTFPAALCALRARAAYAPRCFCSLALLCFLPARLSWRQAGSCARVLLVCVRERGAPVPRALAPGGTAPGQCGARGPARGPAAASRARLRRRR